MNTIRAIIGALVSLVRSWANPQNLDADLIWAISELNTIAQVAHVPLIGAAKTALSAFEANVHNLESGQAVSVSAVIDGKKYYLALFEDGGPAYAALFGSEQAAA